MRVPAASWDGAVTLRLTVRAVRDEAARIRAFELVDPSGEDLPRFSAGAHIDVHVPGGFIRQYSLCSDPADRTGYEIAVLDEPNGRGGSHAMHVACRAGDVLSVSQPRNHFPLHDDASHHLLLAGGIGITPIMSMIATLAAARSRYTVVYCTRSPAETAFRERLALIDGGQVTVHHDGGDPRRSLDLVTLLAAPVPGTHLYCCGPPGMLSAVAGATSHWAPETVHVERFTAAQTASGPTDSPSNDGSFLIELPRRGMVLRVPADQSILEVLRKAGVPRESSCEAGVCATCRTRYLDGEPDHRDYILEEDERAEYLTICCSRSLTERLVLDL